MRLLFVKHSLVWPRSSGHDVHTFHMMKACAELGHEVVAGHRGRSRSRRRIDGVSLTGDDPARARPSGRRRPLAARHVAADASSARSGVSTTIGQISALRQAVAASEAARGHRRRARRAALLSRRSSGHRSRSGTPPTSGCCITCRNCSRRSAAGANILRPRRSRASTSARIVASSIAPGSSPKATSAPCAGSPACGTSIVLPNGVDGDVLRARDERRRADRTAVFWGRLDFGPNIQALEWFCGRVWPLVRQQRARRAGSRSSAFSRRTP